MKKITILLTGASGTMGQAGVAELLKHKDKHNLILFSLPTQKDKKILAKYKKENNVKIIWGDLINYNDVKKAIKGVDIVLHVGALVSPLADRNPELAWKVNYGGTKNIVDALLTRKDNNNVKLVYVGTVAQTGNRAVPVHWGRVGDPLVPSVYDYYALSKIAAERYVIESSLKQWVSIRQTGILHTKILNINDGIAFHQPLNNHIEWVSAKDSGRLLANICFKDLPKHFWRKVYNIGGGESYRLTAYQLMQKLLNLMNVKIQDIYNPNMFALRNFHGQFYLDSDKLNGYLNFRSQSLKDIMQGIKDKLPFYMKLLKYLPKKVVKKHMIKESLKNANTPLYWAKHNDKAKIKAYFGSIKDWNSIDNWHTFNHIIDPPHIILNHGYDETKKNREFVIEDMQKAAEYRGGKCLSLTMVRGDLYTKLKWLCSEGHEFKASPYLVLKAGHWCSKCIQSPWNFDQQAKQNDFLAQVWYADHCKNENNVYQ